MHLAYPLRVVNQAVYLRVQVIEGLSHDVCRVVNQPESEMQVFCSDGCVYHLTGETRNYAHQKDNEKRYYGRKKYADLDP